ncbi:MAG: winged helix-turn-helix transcriptional regulator [Actinobacteria bacterium]|nr:MAG: winged helix-turn-helix transcriptional regulator [Actinomycetota bacterium]
MAAEGMAGPVAAADGAVRLVRWPEERELLETLRAEGTPRLLLVRPPAPAPEIMQCEEDWVRLPADDGDVRARVLALAARSSRHQPGPQVIGDGRLRYGAQWIALSPIEHRLAEVLADCFGEVVNSGVLANAAWPDESINEGALRVHLTRLRRRVRSLGLEIQNVRGRGYLMEQAAG